MADPNEPTRSGSPFPVDGDGSGSVADQHETADWQMDSSAPPAAPPAASRRAESPKAAEISTPEECPKQIGRYTVEGLLGRGAFGMVYRCYDGVLKRCVAVKVPHSHLLATPELYLEEARVLASLEHPAIVPVYDAGQTQDGMCYVVSKFIEGSNLKTRSKESPLSRHEAVELVAVMAEALHCAHLHGIVHRDVKPANILIDVQLRPYLADFGLALREEELGQHGSDAGTPAYMSPEQARSEGHLVDGRSDVFSLGVVFYELLTSMRPFRGSTAAEIRERIRTFEPRPPRQIDDAIPKELERICLKALSKRGADRYTTALDMNEDLRAFLADIQDPAKRPTAISPGTDSSVRAQSAETQPLAAAGADSEKRFKIVPKGLRSFDETDAGFFLKLLPGPYERHGLPESIHFWKTRIEKTDPESSFRVGIIYGPSGCGKSSLVKAGLLPRLAPSIIKVYVEASGGDTEERLLRSLRRQFPTLKEGLGLVEVLTALRSDEVAAGRHGQGLAAGQKVLLVIDQFEQWLHMRSGENDVDLVRALRQCDGARVQCLVMVRDDFWLAVSRFMRALEIRLFEGENSRLVDLFDTRHARKVLAALGGAFGAVPKSESQRSKEQNAFLDQAVAGLAQDGKVVSVRLSLFAEMFKSKPWTPSALREIGGAEGVGVAFLEETFSSPTAPPHHRLHQKAAQSVLAALLPEAGTEIKGHVRAREELLEASGCRDRPLEFDEVIGLLDGELRLVTPLDTETFAADGGSLASSAKVAGTVPVPSAARNVTVAAEVPSAALIVAGAGQPFSGGVQAADGTRSVPATSRYQLTHDYLVPSLRSWLTRKQKATRQGRAEIRLADLVTLWAAKPESRRLPSLFELLQIRLFAPSRAWSEGQRKMMVAATRYHALRGLAAMIAVVLIALGAYQYHSWLKARELHDQLFRAEIDKVPLVIGDLAKYRAWVAPRLRQDYDEANISGDEAARLRASLALLPTDASQVEYLYTRLLAAEPDEVPVIREALAPHKNELADRLWSVVETPARPGEKGRLRAAVVLVVYDPESQRWEQAAGPIVEDLVSVNPIFLGFWSKEFRPVKIRLLGPLADVFRERKPDRSAERNLATNLLADYAADQPQTLAKLVMDADERQFAVIFPILKEHGEEGLPLLYGELDKSPARSADEEAKEDLARRQANAAVALFKLNHAAKAWPLLKFKADPRARTYLIHGLAPLGADATALLRRLDEETDVSSRRALILSLGEFDRTLLPAAQRQAATAKLLDLYENDPDPGLHGAVRWLLRQVGWRQGDKLSEIDARLKADEEARRARRSTDRRQWYVNRQGQTFVIVDARQPFVMGSPAGEPEREGNERQHQRKIGRRFAIAADPVTREQYQRFQSEWHVREMRKDEVEKIAPTPDSPQIGIPWYEAAEYCNWLSRKEGMSRDEWCYEPNQQGDYGEGMRVRDGYLNRIGYRLPTEAEWECACRAGTTTRFYFGQSEALLAKYAWYKANSRERTWPVASLKPNDLGLFDMLGNVWQWCECPVLPYPEPGFGVADDPGSSGHVTHANLGVLRGGGFQNQPGHVRAAYRLPENPSFGEKSFGFRPAHTID